MRKVNETLNGRGEFTFLVNFVLENCFHVKSAREQLRALWTAYCLHNDMEVDTACYDMDLRILWDYIPPEYAITQGWTFYAGFDEFMCAHIV